MMRDPEQTIGNLIDRQNTSFVGSVDEDGYPEVKAMLPPRKREGIRTFYFTSNTSSMRAAHYRAHPQACIYFVDRRFFRGVMLKGTMEVLEDAWAKELIWLDGDETYYPLGVTDPDYCVLRFTAERAATTRTSAPRISPCRPFDPPGGRDAEQQRLREYLQHAADARVQRLACAVSAAVLLAVARERLVVAAGGLLVVHGVACGHAREDEQVDHDEARPRPGILCWEPLAQPRAQREHRQQARAEARDARR